MKTREQEYKRCRTEACTKMLKILFLIGGAAIDTDSIYTLRNKTRTCTVVYRKRYTVYTVCTNTLYRIRYAGMDYVYYIPYTVYWIYRLHRSIIPYTVCRYGLHIPSIRYAVHAVHSIRTRYTVHSINAMWTVWIGFRYFYQILIIR